MEPNIQPTNTETNNSQQVIAQESSTGPAIAIIIVLAMIILGGFYFWGERSKSTDTTLETNPEEMISTIETQSTSDESSSIEEDLNNTELDNIDAELQAI
jgi:hypothetical protein